MSQYLLDTHTVLWLLRNDSQLSTNVRDILDIKGQELLLSLASLWEIAIKVSRGRLTLEGPLAEFIQQVRSAGLQIHALQPEHVCYVATMPMHHGDPFDRMIVAQSVVDGIPLLSRDVQFDAYGVHRIW